MLRKASDKLQSLLGTAYKKYQSDPNFQDALETLGGAGALAIGQAILTDMSPAEIALSTLLGGGAAYLARPYAAKVGGYVGQKIDASDRAGGVLPELSNVPMTAQLLVPGSPGSVKLNQYAVRQTADPEARDIARVLDRLNYAKYKQNFQGKGEYEGLLTGLGRYGGDNAAQAAVALAAAGLLGGNEDG